MDLENNVRKAFQGVKRDMLEIKGQLLMLAERQEKLEAMLEERKSATPKRAKPKKTVKKRTVKRR